MAVPPSILDAKGAWQGQYKLHLSYLPPDQQVSESATSLRIDTDRQDAYATIAYDWQHEGSREEGTLVLCKSKETDAVEIAWVDSWHQNGGVMILKGEAPEGQPVKAKGTFDAGDETWGWTVEFEASGTHLVMKMAVIDGAGEEDWAVHATYERV